MNRRGQYYLGVDVGGTKILAGLFDRSLRLLAKRKPQIQARNDGDSVKLVAMTVPPVAVSRKGPRFGHTANRDHVQRPVQAASEPARIILAASSNYSQALDLLLVQGHQRGSALSY